VQLGSWLNMFSKICYLRGNICYFLIVKYNATHHNVIDGQSSYSCDPISNYMICEILMPYFMLQCFTKKFKDFGLNVHEFWWIVDMSTRYSLGQKACAPQFKAWAIIWGAMAVRMDNMSRQRCRPGWGRFNCIYFLLVNPLPNQPLQMRVAGHFAEARLRMPLGCGEKDQ
jgi:hypothetical protein